MSVTYDPDTGIFIGASGKQITTISGGYLRVRYEGKMRQAHHVAWHLTHGYYPEYLDHIDGDKLNNRLNNLRECSISQNSMNRSKPVNNTSGHKGVTSRNGKWKVQVCKNRHNFWFGDFEDFELACLVADEAREMLHGVFAHH